MVIWTSHPVQAGFYFGPHFYFDGMRLDTFLARFGKDERTLSDGFGLKHLFYLGRGLEVTATSAGEVISYIFYLAPTAGPNGLDFTPADVQTDSGLGRGNTWNDVWLLHGKPQRQKVDEVGDKLYVLEYALDARHELDFYFDHKAFDAPIIRMGVFSRQ